MVLLYDGYGRRRHLGVETDRAARGGCNTTLMEMPGSLRRDLLQIAFLPRYPDDEELQVASAVIYE